MHARENTLTIKRDAAQWLSGTYAKAKAIRRQFERNWQKNNTATNHARLRKQIAWCNVQVNNASQLRFYQDMAPVL